MTLELIAETRVRSGGRRRLVTGGKLTGQKSALKMKGLVHPCPTGA